MYRELKLRGAILENKNLKLLPLEEIVSTVNGVWNLSRWAQLIEHAMQISRFHYLLLTNRYVTLSWCWCWQWCIVVKLFDIVCVQWPGQPRHDDRHQRARGLVRQHERSLQHLHTLHTDCIGIYIYIDFNLCKVHLLSSLNPFTRSVCESRNSEWLLWSRVPSWAEDTSWASG